MDYTGHYLYFFAKPPTVLDKSRTLKLLLDIKVWAKKRKEFGYPIIKTQWISRLKVFYA